ISTSLQAYLFAATRHQSIDYLRKVARQRKMAGEAEEPPFERNQTPEERLIAAELDQVVESTIASLPPQGQKVFRLSREQGMKYHEIAEHLGLSVKTVETHIGRSLRCLRERLSELW
ncbi:sigma-70 family RNA polymerase sigma factor, partial [Arthrospira platensis SPKY1]|nr:sigma-70 family RNA polymerase sigma factor [Arthrospira platensis SPKY1]